MGHALRVSGYNDDELVEVPLSVLTNERNGSLSPESGVRGCWCVETDVGLECMSTNQIWRALAAGQIDPSTKVWRDGFGAWIAIDNVGELTDAQIDEDDVSIPAKSHIRVRRVPLGGGKIDWLRTLRPLFSSLLCLAIGTAIVLGAHDLLTTPTVPQLLHFGPSVKATTDAHVTKARKQALQREREWWRARWPR